jgi:hypothetical protein
MRVRQLLSLPDNDKTCTRHARQVSYYKHHAFKFSSTLKLSHPHVFVSFFVGSYPRSDIDDVNQSLN